MINCDSRPSEIDSRLYVHIFSKLLGKLEKSDNPIETNLLYKTAGRK